MDMTTQYNGALAGCDEHALTKFIGLPPHYGLTYAEIEIRRPFERAHKMIRSCVEAARKSREPDSPSDARNRGPRGDAETKRRAGVHSQCR
jgi:hypothetical protein